MARIASLALVIGLVGCTDDKELVDGFTLQEWEVIRTLSPLPPAPPAPHNRFADDVAAATLGQKLFFDVKFSGPILMSGTPEEGSLGAVGEEGKVSCASCHQAPAHFTDVRSNPNETSLGTNGWTARNTMTLVNSAYYTWSGWQGFIDTLWGHAVIGIEGAGAGNGDRLRISHRLWNVYRDEYNAIFDPDLDPALDPNHAEAARFPPSGKPKAAGAPDGPYESMTLADQEHVTRNLVNVGKAIDAYFRRLVRGNAPFDRYVAGDEKAISAAAKRGLKLFIGKAACIKCHEGPAFRDDKFHQIGVPQEGMHVPAEDPGRPAGIKRVTGVAKPYSSAGAFSDDTTNSPVEGLVETPEDLGTFRTPSLRNVTESPPYMHTGQFATLRATVELYNEGGKDTGFMGVKDEKITKLNLLDSEIDDLVAFLETLTGEPLSAELMANTSAP